VFAVCKAAPWLIPWLLSGDSLTRCHLPLPSALLTSALAARRRLPAAADPALRKKRKQKGGNSGKNFTEGWVEFEDKAKAKEVRCRRGWGGISNARRSTHADRAVPVAGMAGLGECMMP
jgi:hypothetical protein